MKILSYLKKRKDFVKRKQIILFGTMAAVIVGGVSVVHAADTSISSHGEIWFDNETTDTSDDVFFNAADLEMLNKKIDGNQNTINDTINTLQNDLNKEIDEINSNISNINISVNSDGKLVFTDKDGADTVIPFNSSGEYELSVSVSALTRGTYASGNQSFNHIATGTSVYLLNGETLTKSSSNYGSSGSYSNNDAEVRITDISLSFTKLD